ncbi:TetR/AcrR family transcriptional regulator [Desulfocurvus sp.]|jgi:AcrR family transcriptional regulator|uniref:TetR/AcrR family transcriptional regulator n=1 Tax=Desulfocurvus sp. TaxID=2871698 RepID=UPI0025C5DC66|nr:TetR/AcrR family transcriptional regulator [Desulfocurvus sp.]MCK9241479.1 TetR/AcrR family transcriptional regulator [Desulfocurvus sp.]
MPIQRRTTKAPGPSAQAARPAPQAGAATSYASGRKTCARLVQAAGQLAAEIGFANLTTRAVAKRAGETIGSIHYHFRSKAKLMEAVLRHVLAWAQEEYLDTLAGFHDADLGAPPVQARLVRTMVRGHIQALFDPKRPSWHKRILYQAMQHDSALFDVAWEEFAHQETSLFFRLLDHARPGTPLRRKVMTYTAMIGPIIFHLDYAMPIHQVIGGDGYDQDYLHELEDMIVDQTLRALGAPNAGDAPA